LPTAKHFAGETGRIAEYRQTIYVVDGENVASIEFGWAPHCRRVIGVGNNIAQVGTAVHALRERVSHAEGQAVIQAAGPVQLQRVVLGIGNVVRSANRSESFERAQVIDVSSGVRSHRSQRWLVDVGFTLQMKTPSSHVSDAEKRFQEKL